MDASAPSQDLGYGSSEDGQDAVSLMKYLCRTPVDIINSFRTFEFTKPGKGSENGLKTAIASISKRLKVKM